MLCLFTTNKKKKKKQNPKQVVPEKQGEFTLSVGLAGMGPLEVVFPGN